MKIYLILCIAFSIISIITFMLYGIDKRKAKKQEYRIKESVLLLFSFFGGALGGSLGMRIFRHKTKHWYFSVVNIFSLIIQVGLILHLYNLNI